MRIRTPEQGPPMKVDYSVYPHGIDDRKSRPSFRSGIRERRSGNAGTTLGRLAPGTVFQSGGLIATVVGRSRSTEWYSGHGVIVTDIKRRAYRKSYERDPDEHVEWWSGTQVDRIVSEPDVSGAA